MSRRRAWIGQAKAARRTRQRHRAARPSMKIFSIAFASPWMRVDESRSIACGAEVDALLLLRTGDEVVTIARCKNEEVELRNIAASHLINSGCKDGNAHETV